MSGRVRSELFRSVEKILEIPRTRTSHHVRLIAQKIVHMAPHSITQHRMYFQHREERSIPAIPETPAVAGRRSRFSRGRARIFNASRNACGAIHAAVFSQLLAVILEKRGRHMHLIVQTNARASARYGFEILNIRPQSCYALRTRGRREIQVEVVSDFVGMLKTAHYKPSKRTSVGCQQGGGGGQSIFVCIKRR